MSSCITDTCGTGDWTGPLPGDPDNTSILSAVPAFGGIDVSWTYPNINPHAVAHVLLYRGITSNYAASVKQATVAGNTFYDKITGTAGTRYYYWIQIVSVNGTVGSVIGPASAVVRSRSQDIVDDLTGQIDAGVLAQSLKTEIAKITLNAEDLKQEILNRTLGDGAVTTLLMEVQDEVSGSFALLNQEVLLRVEGQNAIASTLQTLGVANANNAAAIFTEQQTRVSADSALSQQVTLLVAATDGFAAAIQNEEYARTTADSALAGQISTAQSTLGNNIASVQTSLTTNINQVDGKVSGIGALYTAKVDVNGLVGGFGVYNDGTFVEAGFDVDRFWVGRTGPDRVKPFIIENDVVYMNKARIKNADIDTLKIAGNAVTVSEALGSNDPLTLSVGQALTITAATSRNHAEAGVAALIASFNIDNNNGTNAEVSCHVYYDALYSGMNTYTAITIKSFSQASGSSVGRISFPAGAHTLSVLFTNIGSVPCVLARYGAVSIGVMR